MNVMKYLLEPATTCSYITTAAMVGRKLEEDAWATTFLVTTYDLRLDVQQWLGGQGLTYQRNIICDAWVLPDINRDVVKRMSILKNVRFRVVKSSVTAIVFGRHAVVRLEEKNETDLVPGVGPVEWSEIELRLEEVLAAA